MLTTFPPSSACDIGRTGRWRHPRLSSPGAVASAGPRSGVMLRSQRTSKRPTADCDLMASRPFPSREGAPGGADEGFRNQRRMLEVPHLPLRDISPSRERKELAGCDKLGFRRLGRSRQAMNYLHPIPPSFRRRRPHSSGRARPAPGQAWRLSRRNRRSSQQAV